MSSAPRTVLFFTTALGGGGAESHTLRVLNHLDRGRFRPMLAVSRRGGSYERFLSADVPVHEVATFPVPSSTGRLLLSARGLRRLVERERPDIVCSVMDLPNLTTLAALRQPNLRVKKVLCVQIAPRSEHERTAGGRVVLAAMKLSYRHADRVIALSSGVRDELIDIVPALRGRVSVIHNACVDERVLSASSSGEGVPKTSRSVVLAVGRLTEQKGFMDLLEAFHHVRKEHDAELWILGTGPLRDALQRRIHELDLAGSVLMLGFRDNPQDFMRRATVFVLSSHWEGFGNVVVEALACGAAVVSTDCPHGPSEIIEHGKTGLLVPVGGIAAMADAIGRCLREPALRESMIAAGQRRAADFSGSVIAAAYADELERIHGAS